MLLLTSLILETDGFVSHVLGINPVLAKFGFAGFLILCCGLALAQMLVIKSGKENPSFYYPILATVLFFMVSLISAEFIFYKPIKDWLPSLYVFTSIFTFYFLYVLKYTSKEVMAAIIAVAIIISTLLFLDRIFHFSFLDNFMRRSAFFSTDIRRVVLLKNEVILGFVAVVSLVVSSKAPLIKNKLLIGIASLLFLAQALIMESRLGFMAMAVACITLLCIKGVTKKTLKITIISVSTVVFVFPFLFAKHLDVLTNIEADDAQGNISIRFETVQYFFEVFQKTYGVGIGMMSSTGKVNNVLNPHVLNPTIHYNITDSGAYSSLFQFGILGLIMWIFYTFRCLKSYKKYYNKTANTDPFSAACFAFLLSFTFNLLPFSFFTAYSSISLGGILLYMAWYYRSSSIYKIA